ncbi:MAG: hypothetical protein WDO68_03475 [Gammaproteobacteria bacterium]
MKLTTAASYLARAFTLSSVLFVAFAGVLLTAALKVGTFGTPLALIMLTWFFRYGLLMMEYVAWDGKEAPVLEVEMLNPIAQTKSGVLLFVTGVFFAIYYAAQYWFGNVMGAIVGLAAVGLLPAISAVQVAKDRALQALDPRDWFHLIRWMKTDYLLVLACILIYWLFAYILVVTPLGEYVPLLVEVVVLMFGWLAVQALLGGAIRERRISDPDDSPVERYEEAVSAEEIDKQRERKIDRIYGEWRSGAQKNAWRTLMREVEDSGDPIAELRWLLGRVAHWDEPRLLNRIVQELAPRLIALSRFGEALIVTRQRLAADPEYRPITATETLRLARIARDGGDRPTARALLRDFPRVFPNDPLQPAADELSRELQR